MAPTPRPTDSSGPIKSICKRYPRSQALAYLLSPFSHAACTCYNNFSKKLENPMPPLDKILGMFRRILPEATHLMHGSKTPLQRLNRDRPFFVTDDYEGAKFFSKLPPYLGEPTVNTVDFPEGRIAREEDLLPLGLARKDSFDDIVIHPDFWDDLQTYAPNQVDLIRDDALQDLMYIPEARQRMKKAGFDYFEFQERVEDKVWDSLAALDQTSLRLLSLAKGRPTAQQIRIWDAWDAQGREGNVTAFAYRLRTPRVSVKAALDSPNMKKYLDSIHFTFPFFQGTLPP
jgi:hypothetical protein